MYSAFLLTSSLLALSVNAIPAPQNAPAPGPDKCGPTTQNTGDPQDTCTTKPVIVTSASAFGTLASSDGQVWLYDWHTCDPTVQMICSQMADNATSGQWYFQTGPEGQAATLSGSRPIQPCQLGFYLPSGPGAAAKPSNDQCSNVFHSMIATALTDGVPDGVFDGYYDSISPGSSSDWIGASINLVTNPGSPPSSFKLPGGAGTGSAVNAGYPSYVMAFDYSLPRY